MTALALALVIAPASSFVLVASGTYPVGKAGMLDTPLRKVSLAAFEIAMTETTNDEFAAFVRATKHVTDAERSKNAMVFEPGLPEFRWIKDGTGSWRHPNGKSRGGIEGKGDHPVTCISFRDAEAYCRWAKVRLPTLDEWEVACRAGTLSDHFFGEDRGRIAEYANIWHGPNHLKPDVTDGHMTTSPVGSFKPNPWGLHDMYGNVFEFCTGRMPRDKSPRTVHARGGSWWCSKNSCCFFNSFDIGKVDRTASFSNQGFRTARSVKAD